MWVARNAPSLTLVHLARLLRERPVDEVKRIIDLRAGWGVDPRTVEEALARGGLDRAVLDEAFVPWAWINAEPEVAWPWMLEHAEQLTDRLSTSYEATAVLRALRHAPGVPGAILPALAQIAVGRSENNRLLAQELLAEHPSVLELATSALDDPVPAVRRAGAQWLTGLADPRAVEALRRAYPREEDWQARTGILRALTASGEDVADLISPEVLTAEAAQAPRRDPVALSWLDLSLLPPVRWASGEPVEAGVVRWWVLVAHKLKSPDGRGLLHLYLSLLNPEDAARLSAHVYTAWVEWNREAAKGKSLPTKGALAFSVAMEGQELAQIARSCLRANATWRAESEAVLTSLRANGSDEAIQVIIAASQRHRLPRVRTMATELIEEVSQERGWSAEELGDRSIPTAGFSPDGLLHLDYGDREFLGRLGQDLSNVLSGPDGKARASLPPARKDEDPEDVKRAKSTLTAARKDSRAVLAAQSDRLHAAMCTQRHWPYPLWEEHLAGHPLASRLVTRLVWVLHTPSGRRLFRPTEDGALLGVDDAVVTASPQAQVSLAHGTLMETEERQAWRAHLADYEISPLFDQLTATTPSLRQGQDAFNQYMGRRVPGRELRGVLRERGYAKASSYHSWMEEYHKEFPTADLRVVVGFTGGRVDQEVSLEEMTIVRGRHHRPVPLDDIPPVLLAEAHGDYEAFAAAGAPG